MVSIGRSLCMLIRMPALPRARTAAAVVVVGSANARLRHARSTVDRLAGETVMAGRHVSVPAERVRIRPRPRPGLAQDRGWFVGASRRDQLGRAQLDALRQVSVDVSQVLVPSAAPTGAAFITVTPDGENSVVVAPVPNALLPPGRCCPGCRRSRHPPSCSSGPRFRYPPSTRSPAGAPPTGSGASSTTGPTAISTARRCGSRIHSC